MQHHNSLKSDKLPTREILQECFDYNEATGLLTWRIRPRNHFIDDHRWNNWNAKWSGKVAGNAHISHKRGKHPVQIGLTINGKTTLYKAHHIIFRIMGVECSENKSVDHINGDPWDNRWVNLRLISHQQNCYNRGSYRKGGKERLLPRGVCFDKESGKFLASIRFNGRQTKIGRFKTPVEASIAYEGKARELFGEFYRPIK